MIRGILFDLGGTLLHQGPQPPQVLWAGGLNAAAQVILRGRANDHAHQADAVGAAAADLARSLDAAIKGPLAAAHGEGRELDLSRVLDDWAASCGVPAAAVADLMTAMHRPWREYAVEMPGAVELLCALPELGIRVGVLSNSIFPSSQLRFEVERAGLTGRVGFLISSADLGWRKPHPRAFEAALERLGLDVGEVVFVGDRLLVDILGAHGAGMRAVLLGPAADAAEAAAAVETANVAEAGDEGEVAKMTPDAEISYLSELLGLLKAWNRQ